MIRTAYVNLLHGNDATATLDKRWLPFRTMQAAITASQAAAAQPLGGVSVRIVDDGDADPAQFKPTEEPPLSS